MLFMLLHELVHTAVADPESFTALGHEEGRPRDDFCHPEIAEGRIGFHHHRVLAEANEGVGFLLVPPDCVAPFAPWATD